MTGGCPFCCLFGYDWFAFTNLAVDLKAYFWLWAGGKADQVDSAAFKQDVGHNPATGLDRCADGERIGAFVVCVFIVFSVHGDCVGVCLRVGAYQCILCMCSVCLFCALWSGWALVVQSLACCRRPPPSHRSSHAQVCLARPTSLLHTRVLKQTRRTTTTPTVCAACLTPPGMFHNWDGHHVDSWSCLDCTHELPVLCCRR